jgi:hypothetical protein
MELLRFLVVVLVIAGVFWIAGDYRGYILLALGAAWFCFIVGSIIVKAFQGWRENRS